MKFLKLKDRYQTFFAQEELLQPSIFIFRYDNYL